MRKEQLQRILVQSRETELEFLEGLTDEERAEQGTFENWSAKDCVAHVNYWMDFHSQQVEAWVRGQTIEAAPQFDQANRKIYDDYSKLGWDAIEAFAKQAHERMRASLELLDEAQLAGPAIGAAAQPFWQNSLGSFYSHKLLHYSDYCLKHGRPGAAGKLWGEWAERVAPLDEGAQWQGSVRYNAACSQALAGDREGALESLRLGLEQNPGLKFWSRRDSDLAILHDDPRYRELVAAPYWWEALEAGTLAEALADQALRQLSVLREAVVGCPPEQWRSGEAPHERPAALALHLIQTIDLFSTLKPGEGSMSIGRSRGPKGFPHRPRSWRTWISSKSAWRASWQFRTWKRPRSCFPGPVARCSAAACIHCATASTTWQI